MAKAKPANTKTPKSILTESSYTFLKNYINNPSPTGFESSGQKMWLEYIKPYTDSFFTDPYGTAVAVINPTAPFKVVIEAHADEISWFVNYISPEGFIYLKRNGGVDHQIAPSMRVLVHGKKGIVKAVFGWPAIHTRMASADSKEPQPKVDNLFSLVVAKFANPRWVLGSPRILSLALADKDQIQGEQIQATQIPVLQIQAQMIQSNQPTQTIKNPSKQRVDGNK